MPVLEFCALLGNVHRHVATLLPSVDPISVGELVRLAAVEGGWRVTIVDIAGYDEVSVDLDVKNSVLTTTAHSTSARLSASARRSICLPCVVSKPELVTVEVLDAAVIVTIPLDSMGQ
ncbi:hypothetical protein T492DRAFT_868209 [Pavlovales sp. CCMP2436]|nr:hypothetical protein T492DRAFT_868209 [Pavlovales sp. CCMP2436]